MPGTLCRELRSGLGDAAALVACAVELARAWHAATGAVGDRGRAIGRSALDLVHPALALEAIVEPDDGQAEVQQVGDDREERGLLPAMLGRGRGERAADLAVERAGDPQPAGAVPEARHLARHPPEARPRGHDEAA